MFKEMVKRYPLTSVNTIKGFILLVLAIIVGFHNLPDARTIQKKEKKSNFIAIPSIDAPFSQEIFKVTRVIDGDTIVIENGQKVRYIGVDAPEIHNPRIGQQCFGDEAASKNKELVLGKLVRLTKDVSETDKYKRLLRYVYVVANGSADLFVNSELVKEGYTSVATFPPDVAHSAEFVALEKQAREAGVGFWSFCQSEK